MNPKDWIVRRVAVSSWVKLDDNSQPLLHAKKRCTAILGITVPQNDNAVSSEMIDCMRSQGWDAVLTP